MKEKEIRLGDVIIEVLLKWRGIILAMFIMGAFVGGASYINAVRSIQPQAVRMEALTEQMEEIQAERNRWENKWLKERLRESADLTAEIQEYLKAGAPDLAAAVRELLRDNGITLDEKQLGNVNYVLYYEKVYQNKLANQEQSILMKIDPDKVERAEMTFLVTSDDPDRAYHIEAVYEDMVLGAELLDKLGKQAGASANHISEIISVTSNSADKQEGSNAFRVTISHYDDEMCRELLQTIIDYIGSKHGSLTEKWGTHDITVLDQWTGSISDKAILNAQTSAEKSILDSKSTILNSQNAFSDEEWYYYNLLTSGILTGNPSDMHIKLLASAIAPEDIAMVIRAGISSSPSVNVRYILAGMILGGFVYVFWIFIKYVSDNRIKAVDRLDELYGIPQLGLIPEEKDGKRLLGFVDKWILALRYRNQRRFSRHEAVRLAAAAIRMTARKEGLDEICLTGCVLAEKAVKDFREIQDLLESDGINVRIFGDVLYDAESMEKLSAEKGVVLIEKAGVSMYTEIAQELELLNRHGIQVFGGILME